MKVGTDGILLGSWANVLGVSRILDIGTGTALLALMAAQRNPLAQIEAIEIDPAAVIQATDNVQKSAWSARITVEQMDVLNFFSPQPFDHILSNPPFFQEGLPPTSLQRRQARHAENLTFDKLLMSIKRLLSPTGIGSLVLPTSSLSAFLSQAASLGLFPARILQVHSRPQKSAHRTLIELQTKMKQPKRESLCIHDEISTAYSRAYQELTAGFYL